MKKTIFYVVSFLIWSACLVYGQVPVTQDTIVVEGGYDNIGSLENTVNGDTLAGAVRINPNRVYKLKANTIYYVQAPILFGADNDTTSTLSIVGEIGGKLPMILSVPKDGGNAFNDVIAGNFTIKNVYWPARSISNNSPNLLFSVNRDGRRVIMENVITEFAGGDLWNVNGRHDKIYLKNCYFRDMNWFTSSWNSCITANSLDTAWVENCSFTHSGLGLLFMNTTKFMYFNHNTMVDFAKYGIAKYQYQEAYFTNNVFVNVNWEGECSGTYYTQTDDHVYKGVADIDTIDPAMWQKEQGFVPDQNKVIFLNSNNIHFTDTCFNQYYSGKFTPGFDHPVSSRNWAPWAADSTNKDIRVSNIPPCYLSSFTVNLAKAYNNIVIDSSTIHDGVDPQLHTKGVHDETALANMVHFSQSNYGVLADGVTFDPATFTFGDYDPTTLPGVKTENGDGFAKISDLREDFSYDANISSNIDNKKLGALHWWANGLDGWDSQAEFKKVKDYYNGKLTSVERTNRVIPSNYALSQNYPNPFNPSTTINFSIPKASNVKVVIYNLLGKEVARLVNGEMKAGNYNVTWNAANMATGTYFYKISTPDFTSTKKMLLVK